tara:strand:- start:75 stop:587 length:513 start_codon:yes stop_codon:yes gene_type:complete
MSNNIVKSPEGIALWTPFCHDPDRKYPHKSGKGYYSITLSLTKEARDEMEKQIYDVIGEQGKGSVAFKSDGTGRSEIKIKCLESLTDKFGNEKNQKPPVMFEGKSYANSFEHATVRVAYSPKYFSGYGKTSLTLKGVEIIALHDQDTPTLEEEEQKVLEAIGSRAVLGNA